MRWYQKEKGHLIVNQGYPPRGAMPLYDEDDPLYKTLMLQYDKTPPLFLETPSGPERKTE